MQSGAVILYPAMPQICFRTTLGASPQAHMPLELRQHQYVFYNACFEIQRCLRWRSFAPLSSESL